MSDLGHLCRICRGEDTPGQPLLHPCKCRGSIKYIHQDCLMEWLKHSNKSTKKCDICDTPYKFRTIYDPNMPKNIPMGLLWEKLYQTMTKGVIKSLSITLYLLCFIVQVPIFWKFVGRFYTWAIDGTLPQSNNESFWDALLFGDFDLSSYEFANDTTKFQWFKVRKFLEFTYFSGIRYILVCVIVHLALFVEHEWIVRDEGYTKLLLRKIGKEPRTKLADMLQNALHGLRNDGANGNEDANENIDRLEMIARALNDIREPQHNARNREQDLMRDIDNSNHQLELEADNNDEEDEDSENDPSYNDDNGNDVISETSSRYDSEEEEEEEEEEEAIDINVDNQRTTAFLQQPSATSDHPDFGTEVPENHPPIFEQEQEPQQPQQPQAQQPPPPPQQQPPLFDPPIDEAVNEEEVDDEVLDMMAENAAAQQAENGDILELLGINLNMSTPILLMVASDSIIAVYLFITYLIPHTFGSLFVSMINVLSMIVKATVVDKIGHKLKFDVLFDKIFTKDWYFKKTENTFVDFLLFTISDFIIIPVKETLHDLFYNLNQPNLAERIILLTIGYSLIGFTIFQVMRVLLKGKKPIMGTPRKVYKILFEFSSTIKVFAIFAIEIFFFPVYCGWLLDFCLAPLLLDSFKYEADGKIKFLLLYTSSSAPLHVNYLRVVLYWAMGTLYMLFFALYIGMIRSKILRPGLLFFIRSPDDPNARLIHDALVKPLMLQLSRIYLSAKVYTVFILVGIGGVTWGLRYLVKPNGQDYNVMLPITRSGNIDYALLIAVGFYLVDNRNIISFYSQKYWQRGFEIACFKLRLSHFILGRPIPQERGYVLYRNQWEQLVGTSVPDYTNPVTYREAKQLFEQNKEVNCYFIPNGTYTRVPDNDTVSRKFIKKLFVLVTKDDKLLSSNEQEDNKQQQEDEEEESSDEEFNNDDNYTIVYRPPNLKIKCFQLIVILWLFSIILLLTIIFTGLLIGRPVTKVLVMTKSLVNYVLLDQKNNNTIKEALQAGVDQTDWRLADVRSLCFGMFIECSLLRHFHKRYNSGGNNEVNPEGMFGLNIFGEGGGGNVNEVQIIISSVVSLVSLFLWGTWVTCIHKFGVDFMVRRVCDPSSIEGENLPSGYMTNWMAIVLHLVCSLWTIIPLFYQFFIFRRTSPLREITFKSVMQFAGFQTIIIRVLFVMGGTYAYGIVNEKFFDRKPNLIVLSGFFVVYVVLDSLWKARGMLVKLNEQVKNEKYTRGRALENMD